MPTKYGKSVRTHLYSANFIKTHQFRLGGQLVQGHTVPQGTVAHVVSGRRLLMQQAPARRGRLYGGDVLALPEVV